MDGYRNLSVEENRFIQLQILDKLDAYCKENRLKYFIIAGTLLGAVRHKGYIPWDDDIDTVMLRDDYEKLIENFKDEEYYIVTNKNHPDYPFPFAKLCLKDSIVKEDTAIMKSNIGINIDIFPIDWLPDDKDKQDELFKQIKRYRWILNMKDTIPARGRSWHKNLLLRFFHILFAPISAKSIVDKIERFSQKYNGADGKWCAEIAWGCGEKEVVARTVFENVVQLPFENKMYDAPAGWEEWLLHRYGDYMKLPPIEQQKTHHSTKAFIKN